MNITIEDKILNTFPTDYAFTLDLSDDEYFDRFNPIKPAAAVQIAQAAPAANTNIAQRHKRSQSSSASPIIEAPDYLAILEGNLLNQKRNLKLKLKKEYRILHDLFYCQFLKDCLDNNISDDNTKQKYETSKRALTIKLQELYERKERENESIEEQWSRNLEARKLHCENAEIQSNYHQMITNFLQESISQISPKDFVRFFHIRERKRRLSEQVNNLPIPEAPSNSVIDHSASLTTFHTNINPILKRQIQADQLFLLQAGLAILSSVTALCGIILSLQHVVSPLAFLITSGILIAGLIITTLIGSHFIKTPLRKLENIQQQIITELRAAMQPKIAASNGPQTPDSPSKIPRPCLLNNFNLDEHENFESYLNDYFNLPFDSTYLETTTALITILLDNNVEKTEICNMIQNARKVILMEHILPIFINDIIFLLHDEKSPLQSLFMWGTWPIANIKGFKFESTTRDYMPMIDKLRKYAESEKKDQHAAINKLEILFGTIKTFCSERYKLAVHQLSQEEGMLTQIAAEQDSEHQKEVTERTGGMVEANSTLAGFV